MNKRQQKRLIRLGLSLIVALSLLGAERAGWLSADAPISVSNQLTQQTPGLYQVVRFDDGDTITVDMEGKQEKIRFIGVDTPETQDPRKPVQCFGKAASQFTKDVIGSNRVRLEADPTNSNRDRYQRLLRYVYLPDGTLVNKRIIQEGYGFALTGFPFTKMEEFKAAQVSAREQNRGLWSTCELEQSPSGITSTKPE